MSIETRLELPGLQSTNGGPKAEPPQCLLGLARGWYRAKDFKQSAGVSFDGGPAAPSLGLRARGTLRSSRFAFFWRDEGRGTQELEVAQGAIFNLRRELQLTIRLYTNYPVFTAGTGPVSTPGRCVRALRATARRPPWPCPNKCGAPKIKYIAKPGIANCSSFPIPNRHWGVKLCTRRKACVKLYKMRGGRGLRYC